MLMFSLGLLTAAEEINAASGRMVSEDVPAKEMREAERHMSLIQQFTMTRRQFYVKEARAIRRQRQLRAAGAAYWESALRDFAKADRVKLCLTILQSGVPASLRPKTWVMALGDALKISRADFEAAQQKAPGLMAGEKEGSPYDFYAFSSVTISLRAAAVASTDSSPANTVRISLAEWRSRLIEDLQKGLPHCMPTEVMQRASQPSTKEEGPNTPDANSLRARGTALADQATPLQEYHVGCCSDSAVDTKPPLPISEHRSNALLEMFSMKRLENGSDGTTGAITPDASYNNSTKDGKDEDEDHDAARSPTPLVSDARSWLHKSAQKSMGVSVDSSFSFLYPNMVFPMHAVNGDGNNLFLSSLLNENVVRRVDSLLQTYMELRPEVVYVKDMPCLAMMLSLVIEDPWELCVCFTSLLEYGHLVPFIRSRKEGITVHFNIFDAVLRKAHSALYGLFQKYEVPLDVYLLDWWTTVFLRTLPVAVALRVWDLFLLDEHYLYRTTLAILVYRFGLYNRRALSSLPQSYCSQEDVLRTLDTSSSDFYMSQSLFCRILANDKLCGISMRSIRSIAKRVTSNRPSH
ncbi:hypothetical protein C3747_68g177 [Trypanosoma cruzi]|uniref:Rab-GAP TBC domain-containing protein n=2 Tax=Trypanosoma cruzi TaxID=5693 RepID=Q4DMX0_TRYCC|nr:hypothetical protein Tc00.1047053511529.250 [Trypanosoma cruzi]EAN93892.1 hypothetical protein Tc00.1047053511529.250 [Trypanosoma cruzi]PWV10508.1 hypothetical protein C3747_68g177 [Trypanosoma cruzi]RNC61393.1 TBC1 domain family member 14 [Trypanosoma cruzi]|eukprot:XP_815743.1 hypothetical protein [Trypanosoma cruzi strain CL Brener]